MGLPFYLYPLPFLLDLEPAIASKPTARALVCTLVEFLFIPQAVCTTKLLARPDASTTQTTVITLSLELKKFKQ